MKNGYEGLYQAMKRHPELFLHVKQDRPLKSPEEWVAVAESLMNEHGGILPCRGWLRKSGYEGLYQAMMRHPDLFFHIPQEAWSGGRDSKLIGIRINGEIQKGRYA